MLNGYTLGFFLPKQVKHAVALPPKADAERKVECRPRDLTETRPDAASECREVPAAFHFYRYF
jgi:hypothetical protein